MSRKAQFAEAARRLITNFDDLTGLLNELDDIYRNSGYTPSGSDPITDSDLEGLGITVQDLANVSTFTENLSLFLNNGDPLQFNYAAKIDALRTMPS